MRASALVQVAAAALMTALALAGSARATVVVMPTLEEMAVAAEIIAHVKVGAPRTERDGKGRIITITPLEVIEGVKGAKAGDALGVFQVGGSLEGRSSWIAGAHHFVEGEELVFVGVRHTRGPGSVIPYGIGFGLFAVTRDDFGVRVVETMGDVVAMEKSADGRLRQVSPKARSYDSLPGFLTLLRRAATAEEAPKLMQVDRKPHKAAQQADGPKGG